MRKEARVDDYYTLADLLGHWERGELTLAEVLAQWPSEDKPSSNEELLRELLRALVILHR